jgi:hypothetical protein
VVGVRVGRRGLVDVGFAGHVWARRSRWCGALGCRAVRVGSAGRCQGA